MSEIVISGPIGFLPNSKSAVFFSMAKTDSSNGAGTVPAIKKIEDEIKVAPWGEDNRFPQNIQTKMAYCNVGKSALGWKARALYGDGILPGRITGFDSKTNKEIFTPLDRIKHARVYAFIESRDFLRQELEFLQDWCWYSNTFSEMVFNNACDEITAIVHQESCDCRYQQMDDNGRIPYILISKLWGASQDQWVRFDPNKKILGLSENPRKLTKADNNFIKYVPCIDMYNAVASARKIAEDLKKNKKDGELKSAILPSNYPSPNKTYYQESQWDGARLSGWIDIACKIPSILKAIYEKAFDIKYHIEIPENFFEQKYGVETWQKFAIEEQTAKRTELLKQMDDYLSGNENKYNSFVSFFQVDNVSKAEFGRIKITAIEDKGKIDKEILSASAADIQILIGMNVHPTLFGAGTIGTGTQRTGGSDQREAFLIYNAMLKLERQVMLEPLYLVRDFNTNKYPNDWAPDIQFRIIDTELTTLDKNTGTTKTIS